MDCGRYRRAKLADPDAIDPGMAEHSAHCRRCGAFTIRVDALERRLKRVVAVPMPEGFADQIIARHCSHGLASRWARVLIAVLRERNLEWSMPVMGAAAALLALSLLAPFARDAARGHTVADAVIEHVASEPEVLMARENVETDRLSLALSRYGAAMRQPLGRVRHLGDCIVAGAIAQHVVVDTVYGSATLLLLPGEPASLAARTKNGFTATVMPLRHGSLSIVTPSPGSAKRVRDMIEQRVSVNGPEM